MPWGGGGANARKNQRDLLRPSGVRRVIELEALELSLGSSSSLRRPRGRRMNCIFVSPTDPVFSKFAMGTGSTERFVYARTFAQYLALVECNAAVPDGAVALSVVQRKNFEVALLSDVLFSAYPPELVEEIPPLEGIIFDIRPRFAPAAVVAEEESSSDDDGSESGESGSGSCSNVYGSGSESEEEEESRSAASSALPPSVPPPLAATRHLVADAAELSVLAWEQLSGGIATVDEMLILRFSTRGAGEGGEVQEYVATVAELRAPFDAAADLEALNFEHIDIARGRVVDETKLYLRSDPIARLAAPELFTLNSVVVPPPRTRARLCVRCITSDGEEVPVKKLLLRPCISLTAQVLEDRGRYKEAFEKARDAGLLEGDAPTAHVAMDCCIFDRILLYLEAAAAGPEAIESFIAKVLDLPTAEELLQPSKLLGCGGLEELCAVKLGAMEARVRTAGVPWEEVMQRNKSGEVLIVLDMMVFDVTRWLPYHPGGAAIIPKQALSMDSARFFEIYHAGDEPFKYLKEFYCGDIVLEDQDGVPRSEAAPSVEFLEILREWSPWRVTPLSACDVVHKSF